MTKTTDFQLKAGAVLTFFGSPMAYTNANLTDEVALRYLSLNVNNVKLFSSLPSNWEERLAEFIKNGTNDNGSEGSDENSAIAVLADKLAVTETMKMAAESERDSIKNELAEANSSLESVLAERDELLAQNEALTAERDKLLSEVESLKSKSGTRAKKNTAKETAPAVQSEQSLDLGE